MATPKRTASWSVGLLAVTLVAVLASASIGPVDIPLAVVAKSVLNAISVPTGVSVGRSGGGSLLAGLVPHHPTLRLHWTAVFAFDVPEAHATIVVDVRLPRILLAAVVGFALAAAGTVMQGFFRNPLADPAIIGVSAGAATGAVAAITAPMLVPIGLKPAAFVGGVGAAFLVYAIATERGRTPVATLLLAGIAVQTFLGAAIAYLILHSGDSINQAVHWLMGHLHHSSWSDVAYAAPVSVAFFLVLMAYTRDLNVLLLGEEDAHHLGVSVEPTKRVLLGLSSAITAAAVAVSGIIGFVGLVVPHVMRLIVGPDHRILLPTAALGGATFLVVTDTFARAGPVEVPVGIVTAAVGAPFFVYLLKRREVHRL